MTGFDQRLPLSQPVWPADTASRPRQRSIRPYLALAMLATIALSTVLDVPEFPAVGVLAALAFGSFALALHRTAWILVPVIITELTLYSYTVPALGMAQRLAVILVATLLAVPFLLRSARFSDRHFQRVLLPAISLVVIATIVNSMFSMEDYVFKYLRYQVGQVLVLVLAASLIRNREELLWLTRIALGVGVLVAIAAVWQHVAPASAPYGAATAEVVRAWKGRSIGLIDSPLALANQMTFVLAPILGVLLSGRWRFDKSRLFLGTAAFLIFAGLTYSYTRSGFFALGPGLLVMGLFLRGQRRIFVVGGIIAIVAVFPLLETTGLLGQRYFRGADEDQSAATHAALWEVSLAVALDHPIVGIGHEHFEEVALDYTDAVNDDGREISGAESVGQERPHNDFLSVWMSWGIFALIAYVAIFVGALLNFIAAAKSRDTLIRGLAIGYAGGIVVYGVSSAYHNYMDSSVFLWLYAGISFTLVRLTRAERDQSTRYPPPMSLIPRSVVPPSFPAR